MKFKCVLTASLLLSMMNFAQAKVISVSNTDDRSTLIVEGEACPGTFQSINTDVKKIGQNSVAVAVAEALPVLKCPATRVKVFFQMNVNQEILDLDVDPEMAKIFVQIR